MRTRATYLIASLRVRSNCDTHAGARSLAILLRSYTKGFAMRPSHRQLYAIISAILLTVLAASVRSQTSGGSAGGTNLAVQRYTQVGDLSYPGNLSQAIAPTIVALRKPPTLDQPGVYIWRDDDGSWCMGLVSVANTLSFSGTLSAQRLIVADAPSNAALQPISEQQARLNLEVPPNTLRVIRFQAAAGSVEFDVHVSSASEQPGVFIGSGRVSPVSSPFRIAEARVPMRGGSLQQNDPQSMRGGVSGGGSGEAGPGRRRP